MANRDFDGGYLPTHVASREEFLAMAALVGEYNRGSIEWTVGASLQGLGVEFFLDMAKASGRPVNWNAVAHNPSDPEAYKMVLRWNEKANREAQGLHSQIIQIVNNDIGGHALAQPSPIANPDGPCDHRGKTPMRFFKRYRAKSCAATTWAPDAPRVLFSLLSQSPGNPGGYHG